MSWDNYPVWGKLDMPYGASEGADLMHSLKKKTFWIVEQAAGPGGWGAYGRIPCPGENNTGDDARLCGVVPCGDQF